MKRLIFSTLIILSVMSISCSDMLETIPPSQLSENSFWKQKSDFNMGLTACYSGLQNQYLSWGLPMYDCLTDNAFPGSDGGSSFNGYSNLYQIGQIEPSINGFVPLLYQASYAAIARVNIFLAQLALYNNIDITADQRKQMIGEATFIRAYCYYMLYFYYGEVPVITEPRSLDNQYQPKSKEAEVYAQLLKDLKTSIDNLKPGEVFKTAGGRATHGAAQALKARLLMYHAYNMDGSVNRSEIQEAFNILSGITGYSLNPNFENNFLSTMQEASPELIFTVKYLAPNSYHNFDQIYGLYNRITPVANLVEEYEPNDKRLNLTLSSSDYYTWPSGQLINLGLSTLKKHLIKWIRPVMKPSEIWTPTDRSEQDGIIFRWGELMLLKAEAAIELDNLAEAKVLIDQIRQRAGLPVLAKNLSAAEMRKAVRHERRVETAFEGYRYYDMKRWKILNELNSTILDPAISDYKLVWKSQFYNFPLPQAEIDKSGGVLIQNPNYK